MNRENLHDWRAYLHALPEAEPPAELWQRIAQARTAKPASRSSSRWLPAAGLAAAVALAAVIAWPARDAALPEPPAVAVDGVALRALDDAIALAYASNASQDELDSLWQTRERLMQGGSGEAPMLARL